MSNDESLDINVKVTIESSKDDAGIKIPGYEFDSSVYEIYKGRKTTDFLVFNTETNNFEWVDTDLCVLE